MHWLRLLAKTNPEILAKLREIWEETQELLLIFSKIIVTSRKRKNENLENENLLKIRKL